MGQHSLPGNKPWAVPEAQAGPVGDGNGGGGAGSRGSEQTAVSKRRGSWAMRAIPRAEHRAQGESGGGAGSGVLVSAGQPAVCDQKHVPTSGHWFVPRVIVTWGVQHADYTS